MKRFYIEGTGVLNGEVEWTNITFAMTLNEALVDSRISYEKSHGKLAGTQISLEGWQQEEWIPDEISG